MAKAMNTTTTPEVPESQEEEGGSKKSRHTRPGPKHLGLSGGKLREVVAVPFHTSSRSSPCTRIGRLAVPFQSTSFLSCHPGGNVKKVVVLEFHPGRDSWRSNACCRVR